MRNQSDPSAGFEHPGPTALHDVARGKYAGTASLCDCALLTSLSSKMNAMTNNVFLMESSDARRQKEQGSALPWILPWIDPVRRVVLLSVDSLVVPQPLIAILARMQTWHCSR